MNPLRTPIRWIVAVAFAVGPAISSNAAVRLPAIFGDHMVLQTGVKIPVWGWAEPGEKIKVTLAGENAEATAGPDGAWRVNLPPLSISDKPAAMTVVGKNTLQFDDVLLGDVWICSGQSNMAAGVPKPDAAQANDPQLRFFTVQGATEIRPGIDVVGKWQVCTPETAKPVSAAGYFFAREIRASIKHPFGLIGSYRSSSAASSWVSLEGLRKEPTLSFYIGAYNLAVEQYDQRKSVQQALQAGYQKALADWQQKYGATYPALHQKWYEAIKEANEAGKPAPPRPAEVPPDPPRPPDGPEGGIFTPTSLYNGMIAPLIPYAIKGVIWYQGEAQHARPFEYRTLLARLITDWREHWGEGDFPFLIVQLPNFNPDPYDDWPFTRESQLKVVQSVPNTGMALTIDVGEPYNLHPPDKLSVGLRLAQAAKHVAYGQDVVYSGPLFASEKFEGNAIRVSFTQADGGLVIGKPPFAIPKVAPVPTDTLVGFSLAGEDRKWTPADAKIDGDTVVVSSPQVPHPVAVRYAFANAPVCNLYNKEGLPASPFRTDDWWPAFPLVDWQPWIRNSNIPAYAKDLLPPNPKPVKKPSTSPAATP